LSKESESRCFGVNLNRNWDYQWNQGTSASSFECSDNYSGPKPFSEPESKALSKWLMEHRKDIKIYISLHSYGQLITYPSSDQDDGYQQDELFDMAKVAVEALRATGSSSRYIIDNSNELLYPHSSGAADAFAMHQIGIKYSFTVEMRDTGTHGFLLPSSYIESSAQEAFDIIKGMIDYI
jgi:Zinc carboxypeptidase